MNENKVDVLIIGAGNAGQGVAGVLLEAGKNVAIVESDLVGGTCPNRGCVPKKILVAASESLDGIRRASGHAIDIDGQPTLNWSKLIDRKDRLIEGLPSSMSASLEKRGARLIRGKAKFTGPNQVVVGSETISADKIVVATGSTPRPLNFVGSELLLKSDEFLAMETLPASAIFVGGGVIAFEFAHVLARAGTKVTILEAGPQLLGRLEPEVVDQLATFSRDVLNIEIVTQAQVERVEASDGGYQVSYQVDGKQHTATGTNVFHGAGRVPNLAGLELSAAGITMDGNRLALAGFQSTDNQSIWFAGDVLPTAQLSPLATVEGRSVGRILLGEDVALPDTKGMPSAVYTTPAIASVGLTESQARREGLEIVVKSTDMKGWLGAKSYLEEAAYAKVIVDKESDRIVGAHLLGHGASETIHIFALAIDHGILASQLRTRFYAYPTFANDIKFIV